MAKRKMFEYEFIETHGLYEGSFFVKAYNIDEAFEKALEEMNNCIISEDKDIEVFCINTNDNTLENLTAEELLDLFEPPAYDGADEYGPCDTYTTWPEQTDLAFM